MVNLVTFLLQTTPAFFADLWLKVTGRQPRHLKMQGRALVLRNVYNKFCSTSFLVESSNAQALISTLDEEDKVRFQCDPRTIMWRKYMLNQGFKEHPEWGR